MPFLNVILIKSLRTLIISFIEIDISKYIGNLRLSGLHLDPLGQHLLITTKPKQGESSLPELFYLHRKTTKLKQVIKNKEVKPNLSSK